MPTYYGYHAAAVGSVALTGTAVPTMTEADVVAGGKTIIVTLTGNTWKAAGAPFDFQRQNIIDGLDSDGSEAHGWDAEVKAKQGVAGVVRTSDTVVTITLDAEAAYDITAEETITVTVPASVLASGGSLVATPTFAVTPVVAGYAFGTIPTDTLVAASFSPAERRFGSVPSNETVNPAAGARRWGAVPSDELVPNSWT